MMNMSRWFASVFGTGCVAFLSLGAVACGEEAETDETPSYDRPEASRAFISDEKLAEIEVLGVPIYEGSTPPDISGTYANDSTERIVAPRASDVGQMICDGQVTYTMEDDGTVSSERVYVTCDGEGMSSGILVSGADDCFTLYSRLDEVFEGCSYEGSSVYSGCLSEEGITESKKAWYVESSNGDSCSALRSESRLPPTGDVVVDSELDGLVARVD